MTTIMPIGVHCRGPSAGDFNNSVADRQSRRIPEATIAGISKGHRDGAGSGNATVKHPPKPSGWCWLVPSGHPLPILDPDGGVSFRPELTRSWAIVGKTPPEKFGERNLALLPRHQCT